MTTFGTIIGWTFDGAAYCPEHRPAAPATHDWAGDKPAPVFAHEADSWADGGLSCEASTGAAGTGFICGYEIVESDTCRSCDRSLRDDHDTYQYGPQGLTDSGPQCRPGQNATILCREIGRAWHEIVPGDASAALDTIVAAYAGRVATFDIIGTEEVAS